MTQTPEEERLARAPGHTDFTVSTSGVGPTAIGYCGCEKTGQFRTAITKS